MIHIEQHGPVTTIRMARSLFGRPVYWTAAYWIDGLLIDSGPPCTARELIQFLKGPGLEQVVVTHAHEDHFGGLAHLQQEYPEVRIYVPCGAQETVANPSLLNMPPFRRAIWGKPTAVTGLVSLDSVDDRVETPSYSFRIVETPGHSPDHVSLFEPTQRWLFCGDAFIGGEDQAWPTDYDLFAVVSSLRTMASLRPERMFPGSGRVRRTPIPDIHAKIGYFTRLAEQVAECESDGASVAEMATGLLRSDTRFRLWTGGRFSTTNLIEACRGYNSLVQPCRRAHGDAMESTTSDVSKDLIGPPQSRSTDWTV